MVDGKGISTFPLAIAKTFVVRCHPCVRPSVEDARLTDGRTILVPSNLSSSYFLFSIKDQGTCTVEASKVEGRSKQGRSKQGRSKVEGRSKQGRSKVEAR